MKTNETNNAEENQIHIWSRKSDRGIIALIVTAICWLSLAQHSEAQFGLRETQHDNGDGTWTITTVISNNSTNDKTVAWWTWPATEPLSGYLTNKIGSITWYPPGTPPHVMEPKFPDTFAPGTNLAAGASVTNRITVGALRQTCGI